MVSCKVAIAVVICAVCVYHISVLFRLASIKHELEGGNFRDFDFKNQGNLFILIVIPYVFIIANHISNCLYVALVTTLKYLELLTNLIHFFLIWGIID